jgi:hypothetical protein
MASPNSNMRQNGAISWNGVGNGTGIRESFTSPLLSENRFQNMLWRESRRSERRGKHLLLMLIDHGKACEQPRACRSLTQTAGALSSVIRETDIPGWFDPNCVLGVIFTEFGHSDVQAATAAIESKVKVSLHRALTAQQLGKVHISFYTLPDMGSWNGTAGSVRHPILEPTSRGNELLVGCESVLHLSSRVAALCAHSQRLRLD